MEQRPGTRVSAEIAVRIWGMDADGRPFFQNAKASNLSNKGAKLSHINHALKTGEVIGIQYGDRKARFEVVWFKPSQAAGLNEAGVRAMNQQVAPWEEVTQTVSTVPPSVSRPSDRRRFTRHKVHFPLQISFNDHARAHMQCSATDMGGRGCYVESLVPLAIGTSVVITFWIDSEKLSTTGLVRASDPGVGMGIEFTSLTEAIQDKLQAYLEKMDQGFAKAATQTE